MGNERDNFDWIQLGNVFFVPIIRQRLAFAVIVQRAAAKLHLASGDVVVVDCPESLLPDLKENISRLPETSILTTSSAPGEQEEVFPVVPCDAIVESVRIANERGVPLVCADQDLAATFFWNRHCLRDDNWPDDAVAVKRGGAAYFDLVEPKLRSPLLRIEPVDSWREVHMAEVLRRLYPIHDRLLFVCEASHIRPVMERLERPSPSALHKEKGPPPRYLRMRPSTNLLLQYLDDFPGVVQLYEATRIQGRGGTFSKTDAIAELVAVSYESEYGVFPSARQIVAFATLVRNLTTLRNKVSPDLDIVSRCAGTCLGGHMEQASRMKLLAYGEQIRTGIVGSPLSFEEEYEEILAGDARFAGRSCNPLRRQYRTVSIPVPRENPDHERNWGLWVWPPYSGLSRETLRSIVQLAAEGPTPDRYREFRAISFDGTLGHGIATRATLRRALEAPPRMYVRQIRTAIKTTRRSDLEPIVLVLNTKIQGSFGVTAFGLFMKFIEEWTYSRENAPVFQDETSREAIYTADVGGIVSFITPGLEGERALRKTYREDLSWRVPMADEVEFIDDEAFPRSCSRYQASGFPWWVTLVLGAAEYAKSEVIAVLPDDCDVPKYARQALEARRKRLHLIPLSSIDQQKCKRLQTRVSVEGILKFESETEVWAGLVRHFEERVRQFWS